MKKDTYCLGLLVLIHSLVRCVRELDVRAQLRNNVMAAPMKHHYIIQQTMNKTNNVSAMYTNTRVGDSLVGVKPLGHLHGGNRGVSSCHGEVNIQTDLTTGVTVSGWNSTEHGGGVENLVVVSKGVAGDVLGPSLRHLLPDTRPDISRHLLKILSSALAIPE